MLQAGGRACWYEGLACRPPPKGLRVLYWLFPLGFAEKKFPGTTNSELMLLLSQKRQKTAKAAPAQSSRKQTFSCKQNFSLRGQAQRQQQRSAFPWKFIHLPWLRWEPGSTLAQNTTVVVPSKGRGERGDRMPFMLHARQQGDSPVEPVHSPVETAAREQQSWRTLAKTEQ